MSWTVYSSDVTSEEVADAISKEAIRQVDRLSDSVKAEGIEQIRLAIKVAKEIIDSGAVGSDVKFGITLSGHANPEHKPCSGWANDCFSISIYQQS